MPDRIRIARDHQPLMMDSDPRWSMTWHPPFPTPPGTPHGSAGVCLTESGELVIIKIKGVSYWEFPAGRPEGNEDWEETLRREVAEEACARVIDARLLGFCATRIEGQHAVRIRAYWKTTVQLDPWLPLHEIEARMVVAPQAALSHLSAIHLPISLRAMVEAGVTVHLERERGSP